MSEANVRVVFVGDSASASSAVRKLEGDFGRLNRTTSALSRNLVRGLKLGALAAAAGTVFAIKKAADYESQLNTLQAVSQANNKQMQAASKLAKQLGSDLTLPGTSAADAAVAMTELAKGGLDMQDSMDAARGVLQLAAAAETDVATAAENAADALNAFSLDGDQAVHVADLLANAANKSTGEITDFGMALSQAALVMVQANQDIDTTVTALAALANQGLKGSDAGTSLRTMMLRLLAPTKQATETLADMNIRLRDQHGNMLPLPRIIDQFRRATKGMDRAQRDAALSTIFGTDAIRAINALIKVSPKEWKKLEGAITDSGAAQELAAAKMKGFKGALEGLQSAAETLAINLGEPLIRALTPAVESISDFVGWVDKLVKIGRRKGVTVAIKVAIEGVQDWMKDLLFGKDLSPKKGTFRFKFDAMEDFKTEGLVDKIRGAFDQVNWGAFGGKVVDGIVEGTGRLVEFGRSVFQGISGQDWEGIGTRIGTAAARFLKAAATSLFANLKPIFSGERENTTGGPLSGSGNPFDFFGDLASGIGGGLIGRDLPSGGIPTGIPIIGLFDEVIDAGKGFLQIDEVIDAGKGFLQILSLIEEDAAAATVSVSKVPAAIRKIAPSLSEIRGHVDSSIRTIAPTFDEISAKATSMGAQVAAGISLVPPAVRKIAPTLDEVRAKFDEMRTAPAAIRQVAPAFDDVTRRASFVPGAIKKIAPTFDELQRAGSKLGNLKIEPKVKVDTKAADSGIAKTTTKAQELDKQRINPKVDVPSAADAKSDIEDVTASARDLGKQKPRVTITAQDQATPVISRVYAMLRSINGRTATTYVRTVYRSAQLPQGTVGAAGGGFIPGPDTGGRDAVHALLAPGELVLNRDQQDALGGPGTLARMFGFSTAGVPGGSGIQRYAGGGFVSATQAGKALKAIIKRDKKNSGYKAKSKAVDRLARRLEGNRTRQDNLARSIGQDMREYDISVEEFIKVDADGNETLDTGAVAQRVGEINQLIGRYQNLLGLVDEETAILKALINALEAAIKAWQAEIRDQERVIRETTAIIRDATKKMNDTDDSTVKSSYQRVIDQAGRTRDNAKSKIQDLRGNISQARDDRSGYRKERGEQQYDRRDVQLDVKELEQERADVQAIRARPPEPTSTFAESEAAAAGAEGFDTGLGGGLSAEDQKRQAFLEALTAELRKQVGQLRLALGIQNAQLPVLASYQRGALHVPQTGPYMLHGGEQVLPAGFRGLTRSHTSFDGEVVIRLDLSDDLDRLVDARVVKAAPHVSVLIGREASRQARGRGVGPLSGIVRST